MMDKNKPTVKVGFTEASADYIERMFNLDIGDKVYMKWQGKEITLEIVDKNGLET